jgi:hypothetical protein
LVQVTITPDTAVGNEYTVATAVTLQPIGVVYVILFVPFINPVNTPVFVSIVAIDGLVLIQVPPVWACVSVLVRPTHAARLPEIELGTALIVIVAVALHELLRL